MSFVFIYFLNLPPVPPFCVAALAGKGTGRQVMASARSHSEDSGRMAGGQQGGRPGKVGLIVG